MSIRLSAVNGQFYPQSCQEITQLIQQFQEILDHANYQIKTSFIPKALIVPHAGYIYSGFTAHAAYKSAADLRTSTKRIIIIGPSHRVALKGASIAEFDQYETPCAPLKIDLELSQKLAQQYSFLHFIPQAHQEHSTEVQAPFIQHYFPQSAIVEIVYGDCDFHLLAQLISQLSDDPDNLIVISTDLSHFYTQEEANIRDAVCIEAVKNLDLSMFEKGCEACGIIGVKALVMTALEKGYEKELIDYRTSFDASGDAERVVGYFSALIG